MTINRAPSNTCPDGRGSLDHESHRAGRGGRRGRRRSLRLPPSPRPAAARALRPARPAPDSPLDRHSPSSRRGQRQWCGRPDHGGGVGVFVKVDADDDLDLLCQHGQLRSPLTRDGRGSGPVREARQDCHGTRQRLLAVKLRVKPAAPGRAGVEDSRRTSPHGRHQASQNSRHARRLAASPSRPLWTGSSSLTVRIQPSSAVVCRSSVVSCREGHRVT
jgi:hypothetical protein